MGIPEKGPCNSASQRGALKPNRCGEGRGDLENLRGAPGRRCRTCGFTGARNWSAAYRRASRLEEGPARRAGWDARSPGGGTPSLHSGGRAGPGGDAGTAAATAGSSTEGSVGRAPVTARGDPADGVPAREEQALRRTDHRPRTGGPAWASGWLEGEDGSGGNREGRGRDGQCTQAVSSWLPRSSHPKPLRA